MAKRNTHLGSTLDAISPEQLKYDKNIKELLADKQVLAWILKYAVSEFEKYEIDDIIGRIGDNIQIEERYVDPGLTNLGRTAVKSGENSIPNEGYITFDIVFDAFYDEGWIKVIINIEAQKSTEASKLGYHLEKRIVYYLSRLVSSQKETEFSGDAYDGIKKVRSIWLCVDETADGDSINEICLTQKNIYGKEVFFPDVDIIKGIVIRIRKNEDVAKSRNKLIAMLEVLLADKPSQEKKEELETEFSFVMTEDMEGRLSNMCNFSDIIFEEGRIKEIFDSVSMGDYTAERGAEKLGLDIKDFLQKMKDAGYTVK